MFKLENVMQFCLILDFILNLNFTLHPIEKIGNVNAFNVTCTLLCPLFFKLYILHSDLNFF